MKDSRSFLPPIPFLMNFAVSQSRADDSVNSLQLAFADQLMRGITYAFSAPFFLYACISRGILLRRTNLRATRKLAQFFNSDSQSFGHTHAITCIGMRTKNRGNEGTNERTIGGIKS